MRKSKKGKEKLVITFDPEARREYLTGFQKRKKLRKHKAKMQKEQKEKLRKKEEKIEKSKVLQEKLDKYGLLRDEEETTKSSDSAVLDHHPNHVVVVDMQPQFGQSLTTMLTEESEPQT